MPLVENVRYLRLELNDGVELVWPGDKIAIHHVTNEPKPEGRYYMIVAMEDGRDVE
jgi:hypothetical protein